VDSLARIGLFSDCSRKELAQIASVTDTVRIPRGETFIREGRPASELMVIAEGQASVTIRGELVAQLGPGTFVGEMALLEGDVRSASVTADTSMTVYVLTPRGMALLLQIAPSVRRRMLATMSRRLRAAQSPAADLHAVASVA